MHVGGHEIIGSRGGQPPQEIDDAQFDSQSCAAAAGGGGLPRDRVCHLRDLSVAIDHPGLTEIDLLIHVSESRPAE
eukprot:COSAG01_NODE_1013_length_12138_cov_7.073926_10_plen_76_part_00